MRHAGILAALIAGPAALAQAPVFSDALWSKEVPRVEGAKEYFVAPDGKATNAGTKEAPWDVASALAGKQQVQPGSVVWLRGGRYVYPVRDTEKGRNGFAVTLNGAAGKPVHVRAFPGERATMDGGLEVNVKHVWLWDLEVAIADDWRPKAPSPQGQDTHFDVPTGVLNCTGAEDVKGINCIDHHNTMGIGFWKFIQDGEVHGCIIYDNGFLGTDRPHGPGLYTQNVTDKPHLITDNIIGGNFSTGMQAYGSKIDEYVNDFLIEGNIWCAPRAEAKGRCFVLCGGGGSKKMVVRDNLLYGYNLRVGDKAGQVSEGNIVVRAGFSSPAPEKNTVIAQPAPDTKPIVILRPNKYDPRRANLVLSNWSKADSVEADLSPFLKPGESYRILFPFDFYGKPLAEGTYDGKPVSIPVPKYEWQWMTGDPRELGVFVVMKTLDGK